MTSRTDDHDIQPSDMVLVTECDCCGLHDYDENITIINNHNLCEGCAEDDHDFIRSADPATNI